MTYVTVTHPDHARPIHRPASPLARLVSLPGTWIRRAKQRREMRDLLDQPDRILRDIGVQRYDVAREALRPFWRE